jgi:hypothetical protein
MLPFGKKKAILKHSEIRHSVVDRARDVFEMCTGRYGTRARRPNALESDLCVTDISGSHIDVGFHIMVTRGVLCGYKVPIILHCPQC